MDRIMSIDLERPDLRKRFRGYDVRAVDSLLRGAARTLHELRMENETLRERLSAQFDELERARGQERVVTDVLAHAQRTADETRATAHHQAEAIIEEARLATVRERLDGERQLTETKLELERLRAERSHAEKELRALLERLLREINPPAQATLAVVEVSTPTLHVVEGDMDFAGA